MLKWLYSADSDAGHKKRVEWIGGLFSVGKNLKVHSKPICKSDSGKTLQHSFRPNSCKDALSG